MEICQIRDFLLWCGLINIGILLFWFLFFAFASDLIYHWHTKWFPIPRDVFNAIHYSGIMFLKLLVFVFFLIPWAVLSLL
jgi:hypothetical protein